MASYTQQVIWTAIPNGVTGPSGSQVLHVTAYVSPRLMSDQAPMQDLSNWPLWTDWPSEVANNLTLFVQLGSGSQIEATRDPAIPLDSEAWQKLFPPDSPVRPYDFDDRFKGLDTRRIRSIPLSAIQDFVKTHYTDIAVDPKTASGFPSANDLVSVFGPLSFASSRTENIAKQHIEDLLDEAKAIGALGTAQLNFLQAKMYHTVYDKVRLPHDKLQPTVEAVDFHQALSSLNDHPTLLRRLGLVIDLRVPIPRTFSSPTTVKVIPTIARSGMVSPATNALLAPPMFQPAPRSSGPDLSRGLLRLGDPAYHLLEIDTDGTALRLRHFADNLNSAHGQYHAPDTPGRSSVPALRSGGLAVFRDQFALHFHHQLQNIKGLQTALGGGTPTFHAEDLLQGYRWDVFDATSGRWFSLCLRHGEYTLGDPNDSPVMLSIDDEGLVSTAVKQDQDTAATDTTADLFLQETLGRFTGGSLVAPRPGNQLSTDPAAPPIPPPTDQHEDFKITPVFTPRAGSLPPLRFGRSYRMRARAAYLGGTGLGLNGPNPNDFTHATDETVYGRFEPVPPPGILMRAPKTEGELVDRPVIRSNFDTPPPPTKAVERWIVPPKTSQLMAEQHGMFDTPSGVDGTSSLYELIAARESGSFLPETLPDPDSGAQPDPNAYNQPYYPDATLHFTVENGNQAAVPYLPDPLPRAAAFVGLPGAAAGSVFQVTFGQQTWPGTEPIRLRLIEGTGAPSFSGGVLTVHMPKATIAPVLLSSALRVADLDKLGIWQWILERAAVDPNVANKLSVLKGLAVRGRLWMMTPFHRMVLVHAVRQPLKAPQFSASAKSTKAKVGDTFATLTDTVAISRRSTNQLDVLARWTDPIDQSAALPKQPVAHAEHVGQVMVPSGSPDGSFDLSIRHEIKDTKFHRVKYSLVAKTRFAEYFIQHRTIHLVGTTPVVVAAKGIVEGSDIVTAPDGSKKYARHTDTVAGDYTIDYDTGEVARTAGSTIPNDSDVSVQYLAKPITRRSTEPGVPPTAALIVKNSARPDPPKVLYAVPLFEWQEHKTAQGVASRRVGRSLRVFMDRTWWSSGAEEKLGVVFHVSPNAVLQEWVTRIGFDPVYRSFVSRFKMTTDLFPLATVFGANLPMAEVAGAKVQVAGHEVDFDHQKGMWFADVKVDIPPSYWPFIRMAVARYQPFSIAGAELSRMVLADFVRLAPDRTATVLLTDGGFAMDVSVVGISYQSVRSIHNFIGDTALTKAGPGRMVVIPETRDPGIPDPDLGWKPLQDPVELSPHQLQDGLTRWGPRSMKFGFKVGTKPLRLVFREREDFGSGRSRLVYVDVVTP